MQFVDDRVGIESYLVELLRHFLDIVRMGVADADHGMSAIEVQVLLPHLIPHFTAFALDDVHVEERIYVE